MKINLTLTSPFHHGAGSSGNTSLLRTEEIVLPDGTQARVPFLSGNSVKNGLRTTVAWHAARVLEIEPHSLPKGAVDLIWSGGAITTTGSKINFEIPRKVEELFPALNLFGYAAQSDIIAGTLRVTHFILACRENAWRLPTSDILAPHVKRGAAAYRGEEFGTRHDVAGTPADQFIDIAASITGTTQMIYDFQVLKPGAVLHGGVHLTPAVTENQQRVFNAALHLWAGSGTVHLAAKNSVGYGEASTTPLGSKDDLEWWEQHLRDNRDDILLLWEEVVG